MYKIGVVILHYVSYEDTIECINTLIKSIDERYKKIINIVVVNNGSPDSSGDIIKTYIDNISNAYYIESKKNLGFAKGNNLGYRYAKNNLNCDFIILSNNDILFRNNEFDIDKLINIYKNNKYHILGPDVVSTRDKKHQNPFINNIYEKKDIKKYIFKTKILMMLNYLNCDDKVYRFKKNISKESRENLNYKTQQSNIVDKIKLHGCFLVLSPIYVNKYEGIYDKTFMYMEEDILEYIARRDKLLMIYTPDIRVYHKEFSSTSAVISNDKLKRRFAYKESIKSAKIFIKLLDEDSKK